MNLTGLHSQIIPEGCRLLPITGCTWLPTINKLWVRGQVMYSHQGTGLKRNVKTSKVSASARLPNHLEDAITSDAEYFTAEKVNELHKRLNLT